MNWKLYEISNSVSKEGGPAFFINRLILQISLIKYITSNLQRQKLHKRTTLNFIEKKEYNCCKSTLLPLYISLHHFST
jgi:hypothetical protein